MIRAEIRSLVRLLIDEPEPYPDGTFTEPQLDSLINTAKDKATLALASFLPWMFQGTALVDVEAGVSSYDISEDWDIDDCLAVVTIIRNKTTEGRLPVLFSPGSEDLALMSNIPNTDPILWGQEKAGYVELSPPPKETATDRYKVVYVKKFPDLNHDTSDVSPNVATPGFNAIAHPLIAYEAALIAMIANERSPADIEKRKQDLFFDITWNLSGVQMARHSILIPTGEIFRGGYIR